MKEATEKGGLLTFGLALITAGYGLFQAEQQWLGIATIAIGLALCLSSQVIHVEREEFDNVKREVYELRGKVK